MNRMEQEKFLWEYNKRQLTALMLACMPETRCAIKRKANSRRIKPRLCDGCRKKTGNLEEWFFMHPPWKKRMAGITLNNGQYIEQKTQERIFFVCEDCLQTALSWQQVREAEKLIKA